MKFTVGVGWFELVCLRIPIEIGVNYLILAMSMLSLDNWVLGVDIGVEDSCVMKPRQRMKLETQHVSSIDCKCRRIIQVSCSKNTKGMKI